MKKDPVTRWSEILKDFKEDYLMVRAWHDDPVKNAKGIYIGSLADTLQGIAVMEYILHQDVMKFKTGLVEATKVASEHFTRFNAGEPIDESQVSMLCYQELLDALASGDMEVALMFSRLMGGREEIEREHDHLFAIAMGYTLKAILEDKLGHINQRLYQLDQACMDREYRNFTGYPVIFRGIVNKNLNKISEGFSIILKQHAKECKPGRMFYGITDEYLYTWGIGMANLCRYKGFDVQISDPLIPSELLIPVFKGNGE